MTPHEIKVLLHIHAISEPFKPDSDAYGSTLDFFTMKGLICKCDDSGSGYRTTDMGVYMVEMICNTPLPAFYDPRSFQNKTTED